MNARGAALLALTVVGLIAFGAPNALSATSPVDQSDPQILERWIERHWPKATDVFVNCPTTKSARAEGRCEFRFVDRRQVRQGQAVFDFDAFRPRLLLPAPRSVRECPDDWNAGPRQQLLRLQGKGIPCYLALTYGSGLGDILSRRAIVPKRFAAAAGGSSSRGFVINRFSCTARSRDLAGNTESAFREVSVRCRNRFGDEFLYVYNATGAYG